MSTMVVQTWYCSTKYLLLLGFLFSFPFLLLPVDIIACWGEGYACKATAERTRYYLSSAYMDGREQNKTAIRVEAWQGGGGGGHGWRLVWSKRMYVLQQVGSTGLPCLLKEMHEGHVMGHGGFNIFWMANSHGHTFPSMMHTFLGCRLVAFGWQGGHLVWSPSATSQPLIRSEGRGCKTRWSGSYLRITINAYGTSGGYEWLYPSLYKPWMEILSIFGEPLGE